MNLAARLLSHVLYLISGVMNAMRAMTGSATFMVSLLKYSQHMVQSILNEDPSTLYSCYVLIPTWKVSDYFSHVLVKQLSKAWP